MIINNNIKKYIEEKYNVKVEEMNFDNVINDNFCTYYVGSIVYSLNNNKLKVIILNDITDEESVKKQIDNFIVES